MADLAASEGADCGLSEKLPGDQDGPEIPFSEAIKAPLHHLGAGDSIKSIMEPTGGEANSSSENQGTVSNAAVTPSCSTPVTVGAEDAQCPFKTDSNTFIDSPGSTDAASKDDEESKDVKVEDVKGLSKTQDPLIESPVSVDIASQDAKEGTDFKDRGSGEDKSENDRASPAADSEKRTELLGEVIEKSALHAPAAGAISKQGKEEPCQGKEEPCQGKEEPCQGEPVIDLVTDDSRPDDDTGEDSDNFEDAPTGPDKDDNEGDSANSVTKPLREEATQQDEVTGDSGQPKYEDACFDLDKGKLKGDNTEPPADLVKEEQVPASFPTDDSPQQHEDASFNGPDMDSPVAPQVEEIPAVPVELPAVPSATSNCKDQAVEDEHATPSCSPAQDVQGKSWADEPLAAEPSGQKSEAIPDLQAADLPSPGHLGDGLEEEAGEELELHATQLDEVDDSGIMESGVAGPGEEVEDEEEEDCIEGERQQGDGEESVAPSDIVDKELDFDEDKRNPQYIPKKGAFYQHDDRMVGDEEVSEVQEEKKDDDKSSQKNKKKLWQDDGLWSHDMFNAEEQGPKSKDELVATYGYDIRSETMPPRARRRRRYGRGPNKYQRNWEDEDAYSARPSFGRGGGMRGGHRGRGGHGGNPSFRDEDFPDLNAKPPCSESGVNQDRTEVHAPAHKPFKGPEHRTSDGPPPQQDWDPLARNSGQSRRGWGKRPEAPRRASDRSPKRPENELAKELAPPLSQRGGGRSAPRPSLKPSEPPHHGAAAKPRAGKQTTVEQERNLRGGELSDKPTSKADVKVDVKEGGSGADSKSTAVVAPRTGPLGSTETTAKPKRYSSLRQRPMAEATPYTQEPGVVAPQIAGTQAPPPPPGSNPPQPTILAPAHFQGPYSPYPDGYMLPPPGQAPAVLPPQNQPPPVMAPPGQIPGSFLPAPTGLVSFPPQYPPPYTFPAQYPPPAPAAPAVSHVSGANIPQTQAQKPPYYHGDIIYYNTQSQQHKQRPTPPRRPKAAIPIVPPPDSRGVAQEGSCEPDGCVSHQNRMDEDVEDRGIIGAGPSVQEGLTGQQAVGGL